MDRCRKHGKKDLVYLKNGRVKCRICQREYQREHYKKKSKYYQKRAAIRQKYLYDFVNRIKKLKRCENCGEDRWWVLDFHHRKGYDKINSIGQMCSDGGSLHKIKEEIRKCEVLCANCHRDLHYQEKNSGVSEVVNWGVS